MRWLHLSNESTIPARSDRVGLQRERSCDSTDTKVPALATKRGPLKFGRQIAVPLFFRGSFMLSKLVRTLAAASLIALLSNSQAFAECGRASWYALHSKTASGEMMNPAEMTAAHPRLKFGTKVRVRNANNSKSVVVRINDRGPFVKGRIIDLSKAAAGKIGMIHSGHAPVCIERIS